VRSGLFLLAPAAMLVATLRLSAGQALTAVAAVVAVALVSLLLGCLQIVAGDDSALYPYGPATSARRWVYSPIAITRRRCSSAPFRWPAPLRRRFSGETARRAEWRSPGPR
jgi:hypothetical protein